MIEELLKYLIGGAEMGELLLVHPLIMATLGIGAAVVEFLRRRTENVFSRLLLGMWFLWVYFQPGIDPTTQRVVGRWVVASMLFVEIVGHIIYTHFRKKYRGAISELSEEG